MATKKPINEDACEMLAGMIEPMVRVCSDEEIKEAYQEKGKLIVEIVALIMRKYPTETVQMVSAFDGKRYEDAKYDAGQLLTKFLGIIGNPTFMGFFNALLQQKA